MEAVRALVASKREMEDEDEDEKKEEEVEVEEVMEVELVVVVVVELFCRHARYRATPSERGIAPSHRAVPSGHAKRAWRYAQRQWLGAALRQATPRQAAMPTNDSAHSRLARGVPRVADY
ncbi:hypothetical protein M0802_007989 [Mischocyttarus mexicanus]|nr:hypothetical protein M0802_007989 [Mischocyttarus mexicanus]